MTQITVRKVDEVLAGKIREKAKQSGETMNALVLRLLRMHFGLEDRGDAPRNRLSKRREGWVEDRAVDAALAAFGAIDEDDWK